jgi:PAS domain-containing protein
VQEKAREPLRILIVEDSPDDAAMLLRELRQGGYDPTFTIVDTASEVRRAVASSEWDIVVSDYNLPAIEFSEILAASKACDPDRPVIVVSGAVGEETAVSLMRAGASDLVLKGNLSRLVPAIRREVAAAQHQYARRESDQRFRDIVAVSGDCIWETDAQHRLTFFSDRGLEAEWADPFRSLRKTIWEVVGIDPAADEYWRKHKAELDQHQEFRGFRVTFTSPSGNRHHISTSGVPVRDRNGAFRGYRGTATDETLLVEAYWRAEEAEALLRDAVESVSEGFVIVDAADRIVMVNEAYRKMYPDLDGLAVPGAIFADVLREVASRVLRPDEDERGDDWLADRLGERRDPIPSGLAQLANGRWVLTTERRMRNGGIAGLWMDVSALKGSGQPAPHRGADRLQSPIERLSRPARIGLRSFRE